MNFIIFLIFFSSIFTQETVIQKIAKLTEGVLDNDVKIYTRKLTYVWTIFLFINFIISLLTFFLSDKIWIIYNGFISYFLIGLLFITEYLYRVIFKRGIF